MHWKTWAKSRVVMAPGPRNETIEELDVGSRLSRLSRCHVLITVPVHNEEKFLSCSLRELSRALSGSTLDYTLAVAEDGSEDGTKQTLERLRSEFPGLVVRTETRRLGRGKALRDLWTEMEADIYAFIDADLSSSPEFLIQAIRKVADGVPIAIGSRYVLGARVNRPPLRSLASRFYNRLVREMFSETIQDHQCGLKVFSKSALQSLLPLTKSDSWFWDTEILIVATRLGYLVAEIPVVWTERRTKRTPIGRLLSDVWLHGEGLLSLRQELDRRIESHLQSVTLSKVQGT